MFGGVIFGPASAAGVLVLMLFAYAAGRYEEEMDRRAGLLRSATKRENSRRENDDWSRDDDWARDNIWYRDDEDDDDD